MNRIEEIELELEKNHNAINALWDNINVNNKKDWSWLHDYEKKIEHYLAYKARTATHKIA